MSRMTRLLFATLPVLYCLRVALVRGQDIGEVVVERGEFFTQCTSNRPDLMLSRGHTLQAVVFPRFNGAVLSATLRTPTGSFLSLSNTGSAFLTNTSLGASASAGAYSFEVTTSGQGIQKLNVALPGTANGIAPIRVANFVDTQQVDASQDFTLSWDKVPKLGSHDYLMLYVYETNGTRVFYLPNINLSQTNAVIPAGTLQPRDTYRAYLYLRHYFFLSNSHLPVSAATELRATRFTLKTLNPAGLFRFDPNPILAREQDGAASVVVQRTQGSAGEVSVDYFSSDGTAHSGVNFTAVSNTLVFSDGVTNETISVPLLNDGASTAPLRFQLTLTNATSGADLMVRPHADVTVLDSQSPAGTNVNAYLLANVRFYSQTSTNPPSQSNLCVAARFYASIHPKFWGAVTNASLQLPNHATVGLTNNRGFMEYNVDFPSVSSMTKAFRTGKYRLSFDTLTDGSFAPMLALGTERVFAVPHLTNWLALQNADPSVPITLQWDGFSGASTNDYVLVSIRDPSNEYVLRTPSEFEPGALAGTTTSFTIPVGSMDYGQSYFGNLIFVKMLEGKPYSGIRNGIASIHTTEFSIQTISNSPAGALALGQVQDPACPCGPVFEELMRMPEIQAADLNGDLR